MPRIFCKSPALSRSPKHEPDNEPPSAGCRSVKLFLQSIRNRHPLHWRNSELLDRSWRDLENEFAGLPASAQESVGLELVAFLVLWDPSASTHD